VAGQAFFKFNGAFGDGFSHDRFPPGIGMLK
jgi:hypothetical protein